MFWHWAKHYYIIISLIFCKKLLFLPYYSEEFVLKEFKHFAQATEPNILWNALIHKCP